MMLLAFCGLATSMMAQTEGEISYSKRKVVTNRFWDNWFIDAGVTNQSFYPDQEHWTTSNENKYPFWKGRSAWSGELSVGKWATPVLGVRVKVNAGQGMRMMNEHDKNDPLNEKFTQLSFSVQPIVNLTNLFGGYKQRWWEISLYGGAGYYRNFDDDLNSPILDAGVFNTWNVTKRFHINLDIYARMGDKNLDGCIEAEHKGFKNRDIILAFSAGIGVNLGKVGWDKVPDIDAILANHRNQINALNSTVAALEAENADLKNKLAQKPKEIVGKTITEFATTPVSVFFNLNESVIASKKDLVDVRELVEYAKANDKIVVVTGYCDSATGSVEYNQGLSERRAETVTEEIVNMGVSRDKIEASGQGGVADLTPDPYNRRVIVSLK